VASQQNGILGLRNRFWPSRVGESRKTKLGVDIDGVKLDALPEIRI
jgi:hypothetical protein